MLSGIPDPELPVSIVDLGLVKTVHVEQSVVRVDLLPTWTGCPALEVIAKDVESQVAALPGVDTCTVTWCYEPAWSPDRISAEGQSILKAHGITSPGCCSEAPTTIPLGTSFIACPYCGSNETRLDSPYGPTRCRSIHFCESCRNQFEHMKAVDLEP
ncbi:MAG: phenylacetate-CoA oxygenase subunit PaaJ [Phycisphaerales bacterium]|nr:phenylacetate-CoA oxygenase subunit PaaJ [Phycisphaerales bacterium]